MGHRFAEIAFTDSVREVQQQLGSRAGYASLDGGEDFNNLLSEREASFISARDSFYMASVSETGWPYLQHRGGQAGFVRIIDAQTIGFADFSGNRQYVSVGNLRKDDRVSLFFMDYPNRARLKMLGRVRLVGDDEPGLLAQLELDDYRAVVERGFVIHIEAFDWNCPQHITPRYTDADIESTVAPLLQELNALKAGGAQAVTPTELGDGPLPLVITGVRELAPRIRAYELRDPDGGELPAVQAGSHLQIPVPLHDGNTGIRHYSICSNPQRRDIYEIAVLRDDNGGGGSVAVHEQFDIGQRLHCALPQNNFGLHRDNSPTVLIAGGIGITPIKSMAQTLRARGNELQIHYAARSRRDAVLGDRLQREFGEDIRFYSSADGEHIDIEQLLSEAPADAIFYICGPERLIDAVSAAATKLNIDPHRIRYERFSAAAIADSKPIQVELRRSGKQIKVAADQSILDAILDAGINALYSCRSGSCRTCAVKLLDGEPDHRDAALSETERKQDQLFCPCVSRAQGDNLVLDI
jgi:ferredoxin-NADP reductase/predicted pyridoxine 5'-phosphate oxidase superfamily flavin-nucleotide-binding protein